MKKFDCRIAQSGFYAGPVYFWGKSKCNYEMSGCNSKEEFEKYIEAREKLISKIENSCISTENMEIRDTVIEIARDALFVEKIEKNIKELSCSAIYAIKEASEDICNVFSAIEDEYIRERQDDVRGVANEMINILDNAERKPEKRSALCASEISPAQIQTIDEQFIGALITEKGSVNSHASIIAGNLGVPYLIVSSEALEELQNADSVIIDGVNGNLIINPSSVDMELALKKMEKECECVRNDIIESKPKMLEKTLEKTSEKTSEKPNEMNKQKNTCCHTKVYANISGKDDISNLLKSNADGVGLFRTEFLFLGREIPVSEEEQLEVYNSVLMAMGDKEVIIRTIDIGADKKPEWMNFPKENNPALGLRGVRVYFEYKELFMTQIRALLRAATKGNLKVMFPMITSKWEIDEINSMIEEAALQLKNEGKEYKLFETGIMIETPAAALIADSLAKKTGFFSIGTNDLSQYTLALDREEGGLDRFFQPYHESVFRLIEMTVKAGHDAGIKVGVCGQLATDLNVTGRLVSIGVDELSVPINKVSLIRNMIINC